MIVSAFSRLTAVVRRSTGLQILSVGLALLLGGLVMARPAAAQFRDIGYTFEPGVQGIFEDAPGAFESSPLYGGALGLSFGRYFQASVEYFANTGVNTDFSNVGRLEGLVNRDVDVRRYGPRLRFNLYDRRVIPYLTVGSGVMQFDPDGVDRTRTIYGTVGGGVTFSAYDRYRISIGGEMLHYRYDPVATFLGPTGAGNFDTGTQLVTSPSLTASVALFLGGRSLEEQTAVDRMMQEQFGGGGFLRGVQLFVNPFHGRIEFNDALGLPKDQNLAGINAGVSLGPYVGLRGFYWRGREGTTVTEDLAGGFEDLQMYGGELKLRLNFELGRGFVPYAKVGGGYLDVLGGYVDDIPESASPPEDRFFGTGGLGLEVPLTRSVKLSGGARALVMDNPNTVEAGDPGDLYGSLMYTAGIEFRLGSGPERPAPGPQPEPVLAPADTPQTETEEVPTSEEERLRARADSLERALEILQANRQPEQTTQPPPAQQPQPAPVRTDTSVARVTPSPRRSEQTRETMVVPVPESGEIYVRFGEEAPRAAQSQAPAETKPQQQVPNDVEQRVREALRQELRQQGQADTAQALTDADIERLIQRTVRDAMRQRGQQDADGAQRQQTAQAQQIQRLQKQVNELQRELREERTDERTQEADTAPGPAVAPGATAPFYREILGRPLTYLVPITGFRSGEGENQFQLGVRGDYRSTPSSRLHFVPELSFGFGGGQVSPTILVNGAYSFLRGTTTDLARLPLEPYVGVGVGFASLGGFTFEPVTNTMVGVDYRFSNNQLLFLEYSTLDLFDTHRVHLGVRVRF